MADQPKAPKGMEWYYRPGTSEPELRPKQVAEEPDEAEEVEEAKAEEPAPKKAASKAVAKKK